MPEKELKMTFDPSTIEDLGVRMYSHLPPALAELVANAYDADAENVSLKLNDSGEKEIIVEDDGLGMSFDEINDKFLRIGRKRRTEEETEVTPIHGRKIIGKKGLGKLAFFGIAHEVEVCTKKDGKETVFKMTWKGIKEKKEGEYKPDIIKKDGDYLPGRHGTRITLRKVQRKSGFSPEDLANSLSKMFIVEFNFRVEIWHNSHGPTVVSDEKRYDNLKKQVEWRIPDDFKYGNGYDKADQIVGHLIATEKPISPKTNMRGIVLFSRKKMVNQPEYFSNSTSSHFFSYLTGYLEIDFIDEFPDDVIATNRQSLNWEHEETRKLRAYLQGLIRLLEKDWRNKRRKKRNKQLEEKTGIDFSNWFRTLPKDILEEIESIVVNVVQYSELSEKEQNRVVGGLHKLVPEYPKYHWRHLHSKIKEASETDYRKEDYYRALQEAAKRYVSEVKTKSEFANASSDYNLMNKVFGEDGSILRVTKKFRKPNGRGEFGIDTIKSIEKGQKLLSSGVVAGCRNPLSHEEISDLRDSGLFTEKDCLDALSLLSHLFRRLDSSQKKTSAKSDGKPQSGL